MRPERTVVVLLLVALLFVVIVPAAGAGGPPDHSSASDTAIEAAGRNNGRGSDTTPDATPTATISPEETVTPEATATATISPDETVTPEVTATATISPEETATPDVTATAAGPGQGNQGNQSRFPWAWILLALALLGGGAALGIYLKRSRKEEASATIPPDAYRTMLPIHTSGFPPELAGRYDRVAFVGRGGLGQVFSAVRRDDGRTVAVKIPVSYDEATGKTFMKEMRFWEDLVHPNIVQVYSVNILPIPFVEMEYLPRSLESLEKPVPMEFAIRIAAGIAAGLAYAHERGVVHRDIKPHNILLTDDLTPKIADWGMSTRPAETRETGAAGFTLAYAAPEQIDPERFGKTGPATDIYQLGAVLYEMATGRSPFACESIAGIAGAVLNAQPVPPSATDPALAGLDEIVLRCLAKNPADRYRSAGEVLDAIETLMREAGEERA